MPYKIIAFLLIFPIVSSAVEPDSTTVDNGALPLIDSIIKAQTSFASISCKYHHKRWLNGAGPSEYQGDIVFKAPESILMHFLYPADEYVLVNDSTLLIYGVKNNYGIRYNRKCLSPAEKQIAEQVGLIKMNILKSMRSGYLFTVTDTTNPSNCIIAAKPKGGWQSLGKITITIDRRRRLLKSIDLYSKEGPLVSSTKYGDILIDKETFGCFPRLMTTVLYMNGVKQKDEIIYSRVQFNHMYDDSFFSIAISDSARIDEHNTCP